MELPVASWPSEDSSSPWNPASSIAACIDRLRSLALPASPPNSRRTASLDTSASDPSAAEADAADWLTDEDDAAIPRKIYDGCGPRSPTLHTRRLPHVPFRPKPELPNFSKAELERLVEWSPPSSHTPASSNTADSCLSSSYSSSASPFAFHASPALLDDGAAPLHTTTPPPFIPVIPMLMEREDAPNQQGTDSLPAGTPARISRTSSSSSDNQPPQSPGPPPRRGPSYVGSTRAHLLQLACAFPSYSCSVPVATSIPSSAASSRPASPDMFSSSLALPAAPSSPSVSIGPHDHPSDPSRTSSPCAVSSPLSFATHRPDSPTWRPSSLSHQSAVELGARRRAREAFRGKESAARLKQKGLSSRAQQAQFLSQTGGGLGHAASASASEEPYDSSGFSDLDSSHGSPSPADTPTATQRRQPTTLSHRIKPLRAGSAQGYLSFQLLASSTAAAADGSHSPFSAEPSVDGQVVYDYLIQLSPEELAATVRPIRALLPADVFSPAAALLGATSPTAASAMNVAAVRSLSPFYRTLLWTRCVARSEWRKSMPADLLAVAFDYLSVSGLLAGVLSVSKYWRQAAIDVQRGSLYWHQAVAAARNAKRLKSKMKVYRRLNADDIALQQLLRAEQDGIY